MEVRFGESGQPLYALPDVAPLSAARGTILSQDWQVLAELGLYDAYVAATDKRLWPELSAVTAGSWVALALVREHYRALDALQLEEAVIRGMGQTVGERVHGAFLSTLIRLAGKLGMSPWIGLEQMYKLWTRSWRGGAVTVHRLTDTSARVAIFEAPVCSSGFFCDSFAGALIGGVAQFGKEATVMTVSGSRTPTAVAYRVTWTAGGAIF